MKPKIKIPSLVFLFLAVVLLSNSCAKNEMLPVPDGLKGTLKLQVDLAVLVYDDAPATRAVNAADFKVEILKKSNSDPVATFDRADELPDSIALAEGEYYVAASYGDNTASAFENPCYYGKSEPFTIVSGQTSTVSVVCKLSNVRLTVVYSEGVISKFTDYRTLVCTKTDTLIFTKNETRAGFFKAGGLHLESELTSLAGGVPVIKKIAGDISNAAAGKHYEIHIDTSPDGYDAITVSVDESFSTILVNLTDDGAVIPEVPAGPGNGNLLITEIMCDPDELPDAEGEWIEIYNNTAETVNLKGMALRRSNIQSPHVIESDVIVAAGGYTVIGKTAAATANVAYVCSWLNLTNTGLELSIETADGTVLCCIDFRIDGFSTPIAGKSLQLSPLITDITGARLGSNWCDATQLYSTGDYGTPGLQNSACP